jgi:cation transport ATPase
MEHEHVTRELAERSARIYFPLSVGAALLFLLAASLTGDYTLVARIGGAFWVGLLTLIVTTPLVTSWVKGRSPRVP